MIFISHRGNLHGPDKNRENKLESIQECLDIGLDVEIDIWYMDSNFWLGHDKPETKVNQNFLENNKLWCHAKNHVALFAMLRCDSIHCFWHESDAYTITSKGFIWCYPGAKLNDISIDVLPEQSRQMKKIIECYGLCSDYIEAYRKSI